MTAPGCPRCGAAATKAAECPRCGVIFARLRERVERTPAPFDPAIAQSLPVVVPTDPFRWVKLAAVTGLLLWTWSFRGPLAFPGMGESVLHLPNLVFHEAVRIVLLGGRTGAEFEGHDWDYLLTALGAIHLDVRIGRATHVVGLVVMLAATGWAAWRPGAVPADGPGTEAV